MRKGGLPAPRARVLEYVQSQTGLVRVETLAGSFDQHPNTVREHLDALVADELLLRERVPGPGRGRPAWGYRANPERPEPDSRVREYGALAGALAAHIATSSADPAQAGRSAGEQWGRALVAGEEVAITPREYLMELLRSLDFGPRAQEEDVVLTTCPLLDVALRYPDVVCAVHEGMVTGVLAQLGSSARVRLLPFAEDDGCRLCLAGSQ